MARSKRDVRARGVARSLGSSNRSLHVCDGPCRRQVPRDAIAYISRFVLTDGRPIVFCGQCWFEIEPKLGSVLKELRESVSKSDNE